MLSRIYSATVHGITGMPIIVETDITKGLPAMNVVGLADTTVKEARDRIRSALLNSGLDYPGGRITINMAPAGIRKRGSHFDLPMAVGILASSGQIFDENIDECCFIGELSLDGSVKGTDGVLPMVMSMQKHGFKKVFIPAENKSEASLTQGINIYPVENLEELVNHFNMRERIEPYTSPDGLPTVSDNPLEVLDFADVKGQEFAKRAITVAVAGGHGILMIGSPSTGKTMISERIPTIMPKMTYEEIVETTMIYSVTGLLNKNEPYVIKRPFRSPHHRITVAGLLGGGSYPKPGEITLAHRGVLFLDEFGEFDRSLIETLRVPLEKKSITLSRHGENFCFPADFMLVAATNPCRCGYHGDSTHLCTCKPHELQAYNSRFSGPVMDRIDIHIKLRPVEYDDLGDAKSVSSEIMRRKIEDVRAIQKERFKNMDIHLNSQMEAGAINAFCNTDAKGRRMLSWAYSQYGLNPRTFSKIKKIARTIADIEGCEIIKESHIAEALQYREGSII